MRRPSNPEDHAAHIDRTSHAWRVFCVECDWWHPIQLSAMAMIFVSWIGVSARSLEVDVDTIVLRCSTCGANIEYLLKADDRRDTIIQQLLDRTA